MANMQCTLSKKSFDEIWQNLEALHSSSTEEDILHNIQQTNSQIEMQDISSAIPLIQKYLELKDRIKNLENEQTVLAQEIQNAELVNKKARSIGDIRKTAEKLNNISKLRLAECFYKAKRKFNTTELDSAQQHLETQLWQEIFESIGSRGYKWKVLVLKYFIGKYNATHCNLKQSLILQTFDRLEDLADILPASKIEMSSKKITNGVQLKQFMQNSSHWETARHIITQLVNTLIVLTLVPTVTKRLFTGTWTTESNKQIRGRFLKYIESNQPKAADLALQREL